MCELIENLKRIKKSSKYAVSNEKDFTDFNKYMHIHRQIEDDLIKTINSARMSKNKSLILVCGNVGDGKSHLLSYMNNNKYLDGFIIHNDATESYSRKRSEKEELAKVLNDFNDDNINNNSNTKVIVAINLGVLSNFLDSAEGSKFTKLAKYVEDKKILTDTDMLFKDNYDNTIFYNVNFGDYHIYRLNKELVDSPYISSIIDKIFINEQNNIFYNAYTKCSGCDICEFCPVKYNYEMMRNSVVNKGIINIILETIIKDKIIISTRDLLDFFYDIIVHPSFNIAKYKKLNKKERYNAFIKYSVPYIIYENNDISQLISHIKQYDLMLQRTELFDEIIIKFNTTDNVGSIFSEYIEDNPYLRYILNNPDFFDTDRNTLITFFIRLCKIAAKEFKIETLNKEFKDFIKDLYYTVKKDKNGAKGLYTMVKNCVYMWNGSNDDSNRLNINTGNENYVISAQLDIITDLSEYNAIRNENIFERFPPYINVKYISKKDSSKGAEISIDYELYNMLKKVERGYRPSVEDKNHFAGFISFINKLLDFSDRNEEIIIRHYITDEIKEYKLTCDEFGTYEFKEVQ